MNKLPYCTDGIHLTLEELLLLSKNTHLVKTKKQGYVKSMLQGGSQVSRLKGRGMEFSEVREYDISDDVRNIDWKVTAKKGKPHTKIYQEEVDRTVLFCLDFGTRMLVGSQYVLQLVQSAHLVGVLAWFFANNGDKIGAVIANEMQSVELKYQSRRKGVLQLFDQMIALYPVAEQMNAFQVEKYWQDSLLKLERLVKPGSLVVIVSNHFGFSLNNLEIILRYRRHAEVKLFEITDPIFSHLSRLNMTLPIVENATTFKWFSKQKIKEEYQQYQEMENQIHDFVLQHKLNYSKISASKSLEEQLLVL